MISFTYDTVNLGDWIQSIAMEKAVNKVTLRDNHFNIVRRGRLYQEKSGTCVMQGWFDHNTLGFYPKNSVKPIWIGTHFNKYVQEELHKAWSVESLNKPNEVGCRDLDTAKFCQDNGIESYLSRCLTLTLPRRSEEEAKSADKVFVVNVKDELKRYIPENICRNAVTINQRFVHYAACQRRKEAERLLEKYRKEAKLVITMALHCTAPCIAMGIPVVVIEPDADPTDCNRFTMISDLVHVYSQEEIKSRNVDFSPKPIKIENLKKSMLKNLEICLKDSITEEDKLELQRVRSFIANPKLDDASVHPMLSSHR